MLVKSETVSNYQSASAAGVSCKHTTACAAAEAETGQSSDTMGFSFLLVAEIMLKEVICAKGKFKKQATKH